MFDFSEGVSVKDRTRQFEDDMGPKSKIQKGIITQVGKYSD